jgi:hypothetical protein
MDVSSLFLSSLFLKEYLFIRLWLKKNMYKNSILFIV